VEEHNKPDAANPAVTPWLASSISAAGSPIWGVRPLHVIHTRLNLSMFKKTHPILGTRDIMRAIEFYTQRLGFQLAFADKNDPPNYIGFRRDAVELHMQFQFEHEMGTIRLRFLVDDPDALFTEYGQRGVECTANGIRNTPWGTREFALYDVDRNALTFYRHLTGEEKERQHAA
jgi:catechol 2,3-dioxygenase-like lactoylglutathione lyase family enzyme